MLSVQLAAKCMSIHDFNDFTSFFSELNAMAQIVLDPSCKSDGFMPLLYASVDWQDSTGIIIMPRLHMSLHKA